MPALRVIAAAIAAALRTVLARMVQGPGQPSWSLATELARAAQNAAFGVMATLDAPAARRILEAATPKRSDGEPAGREDELGGVRVLHFDAPGSDATSAHVLYFHGGGYVFGSPSTHADLTAQIAAATAGRVASVDYRLAPEHPFPAALEDALSAYRALVASGVSPAQIVVAGDSAGGNLSAALLLALRDQGEVMPACGVLVCPWVDLANSGQSFERNAATDTLSFAAAQVWSADFRAGRDPSDPAVSPIHAKLAGLPPLLVLAGAAEVLVDQIERFAERARSAGVDVELEVVPEMFHDWMLLDFVPQSKPAVERICAFVQARTRPA